MTGSIKAVEINLTVHARATRHIYLDVEALGPPGDGDPFALAAVVLEPTGLGEVRDWRVTPGRSALVDRGTLGWLAKQEPRVLAQLDGPVLFTSAWLELLAWAIPDLADRDPAALAQSAVWWADDWADFAWLSIAARRCGLPELRTFGPQLDASALIFASRTPPPAPPIDHVPHVAACDVHLGGLHLLRALSALGISLSQVQG